VGRQLSLSPEQEKELERELEWELEGVVQGDMVFG
jgi:hypothetical protein